MTNIDLMAIRPAVDSVSGYWKCSGKACPFHEPERQVGPKMFDEAKCRLLPNDGIWLDIMPCLPYYIEAERLARLAGLIPELDHGRE